jgi:hypothetical protein
MSAFGGKADITVACLAFPRSSSSMEANYDSQQTRGFFIAGPVSALQC